MTNKELNELVGVCKATLNTQWGRTIVSENIIGVEFNSRLKRSLGRAIINHHTGSFKLEFQKKYFDSKDVSLEDKKSVIYHELIHTVKGCFNHGNIFNNIAVTIERVTGCTQIAGRTKSTPTEYKKSNAKYQIQCQTEGCDVVGFRHKTMLRGRHEGHLVGYVCKKCGGHNLHQSLTN